MPPADRGLSLVGEKINVNNVQVHVTRLLGEGGFSYVYLCKDISDQSLNNTVHGGEQGDVQRSNSGGRSGSGNGASRSSNGGRRTGSMGRADDREKRELVLKATSIISRQQRDIAEKEAKLLSRLSHPSIIKMHDTCYRTVTQQSGGFRKNDDAGKGKERPQHLILMEFCEGGHALDVCTGMADKGEHFDLSTLIIAFGQICNAVSYLHAQRPPIVHRDLKPANFLIKNGAYKLCDFGSAVFGHVDLKTPKAKAEAEEVIQKTTTQMFRSPEMVDLYMAKKLTQATDVWALGACLYSMAFLQDCFEEGSNLAILSRKYKIPDDNPYGDGLVELIDRMLTIDSKERSDMTEVILCLSAVYSGRPLPPRKERPKKEKKEKAEAGSNHSKGPKKGKPGRLGTFRTDGQGMTTEEEAAAAKKPKEAKKLDPNSAAFKRKQAAVGAAATAESAGEFAEFDKKFETAAAHAASETVNEDLAFSMTENPFAAFEATNEKSGGDELFAAFDPTLIDKIALDESNLTTAFDSSEHMWGTTPGDGDDENQKSNMSLDLSNSELDNLDGGDDHDDATDLPKKNRTSTNTSRRTRRTSSHRGSGKDEENAVAASKEIAANDDADEDGGQEDGGGGEDKTKKLVRRVRRSATSTAANPNPESVRRRATRRSGSKGRTQGKESAPDDPADEAEAEE